MKCQRCKGRGVRRNRNHDIATCSACDGTGSVMGLREKNIAADKKRQQEEKEKRVATLEVAKKQFLDMEKAKGASAKVDRTLAKTARPPCKHPRMHFEAGGLYIACDVCAQAWQALDDLRLTPNFMARGWGFSNLDQRRDPFSI